LTGAPSKRKRSRIESIAARKGHLPESTGLLCYAVAIPVIWDGLALIGDIIIGDF